MKEALALVWIVIIPLIIALIKNIVIIPLIEGDALAQVKNIVIFPLKNHLVHQDHMSKTCRHSKF